MKTWIIEPRDPLIARDGRPFTADPGARAKSMPFPFPSTTTGTMRTRYGYGKPDFTGFDEKLIEEVRKIQAQGPLLVELDSKGEIEDWLLHAPADACCLKQAQNRLTSNNSLLRHCPKECTPICRMICDRCALLLTTQSTKGNLKKMRRSSGSGRSFSTGSEIRAISNQSNSINSVTAARSRNPAFT